MQAQNDTIFALATPPGRSGVAVVRISGPHSAKAAALLGVAPLPQPRVATLVELKKNNALIDRALALYFPAPHSFTGEDVLELHVHGSRAVIKCVIDLLGAQANMRMAEPGEFSRRAFMNGKMDLLQAEGLLDLIAAETEAQRAQALEQMRGETGEFYRTLRARIVQCQALVEAVIDFPDEEIPPDVFARLLEDVAALTKEIGAQLADDARGERIREGITVAIVGSPNVGKSSLLNALAKRDVAIVSDIAGTTRDIIEVHLDIAGFPVVVLDMAGIREASDQIEREGVRRALQRAEEADIRLLLLDATQPNIAPPIENPTLRVVNKCDVAKTNVAGAIAISVKTGQGMDALLNALKQEIIQRFDRQEMPVITRARHRQCLQRAHDYLQSIQPKQRIELIAEELRSSAVEVGKITGKISADEILGSVFSQFCIGK